MSFKLIALDLDETLLNSRQQISPRNREAIRQAMDRGVIVTFNTGRMFPSAQPYARELGLTAPLITYQGAMIKTAAGELFCHQPVPLPLASEVIQAAESTGLQVFLYCQDRLIVPEITPEVEDYMALYRITALAVGDLRLYLREDPTKVLLYGREEEQRQALWPVLNSRFGQRLHVTQSKPCYFEFTHPQASKGRGLQSLADHLGISREEILAFGDSYNDLDFFQSAGFSVAMGNAWQELKDLADLVTDDHDADGVAKAIEMLVLSAGGNPQDGKPL